MRLSDLPPARAVSGPLVRLLARLRIPLRQPGAEGGTGRAIGGARHLHVRLLLGLIIVLALVGHADGLYRLPGVAVIDRAVYDFQMRWTAPGGVDDRVVIVDIDERSLAALGRWPWRRDLVARLVDQMFDRYNAAVVGFDVAFAEPDVSGGEALLEEIRAHHLSPSQYEEVVRALRPVLDRDQRLAEALRGRPVVLSYYFSAEGAAGRAGEIGRSAMSAATLAGAGVNPTRWSGFAGNLAILQRAAAHSGHFNAIVDEDGATRRIPLVVEYQGGVYESLSLAVVRRMLGMPAVEPVMSGARVAGLRLGELGTPVDAGGAMFIPYRGPRGSFRYVSAADVVTGAAAAAELRGKIVLVGSSAPGLFDLRSTPVSGAMPGVEMHANVISGILDQRVKAPPPYAEITAAILTLLIGALFAFWLPRLTPGRALAAAAAMTVLTLALSLAVWSAADLVFPVATILGAVLLTLGLNTFYGYFVETNARREFARVFGPYVPPALVEQMARDPARYRHLIVPRSETLTVLFADLRGFTTVAESMQPEEVRLFLNDYFTEMSEVIHEYQGTVDKYIGDEVMAFWGAPLADPDHARHAVLTALEMQEAIARLWGAARARGVYPLDLGIGVNTGLMSVGDMGSTFRRSYTVLGDSVNLAKRLESLTRYYGVGIIVGEQTRARVPDLVCREIDWVQVRGRGGKVTIYEPLGFSGEVTRDKLEELQRWARALAAYRDRDWEQAAGILAGLCRPHAPDRLYEFYRDRVVRYRETPPPEGWNGVTVFDQK